MTSPRPLTRVRFASFAVVAALVAAFGSSALDRPSATSLTASVVSEADAQAVVLGTVQEQRALARERAVAQARVAAAAAAKAAADAVRARQAAQARVATAPVKKRAARARVRVVVRKAAPVVVHAETAAQRGARVLASLHYPWQRLGYRIEFLPDRHGYLGMTNAAQKLVSIYVRRSQSDLVLAHSIAHELGHALDFTHGSPAKHRSYLSTRGLSTGLTWFGCSGCSDYQTPAGDWAEVFAYWLAGPGDFRSQLAGAPSAAQLRALGPLFSF